ncbi:hypothetical protein [Photorhabdus asymbiotica]|uniref:hypothetical protein n=1 Tax=Photorhabdus asymbiotica TaxID=291112 RepID=UPI003DA78FE3
MLAATPTFNRETKILDTFKKTKLEEKDCLIHTREEQYNFHGEKRTDFVYCKPYGYVQKNVYEKDGTYTEFIKLRKLDEL